MSPCFRLSLAVLVFSSGWASAQNVVPPAASAGIRSGYLAAGDMPDLARIVRPAPTTGDVQDVLDRATFRATRSFSGSPRWALALKDNEISSAAMMRVFSCSLGTSWDRENAPRLTALLARASVDAISAFSKLKDLYGRKRPFLVDEGSICLPSRAGLANNPDYPSGHATLGWELGLILAELAPDASAAVLARARAFGESRVICGVHNVSAVEAGWMTGAALVAALHGSAAFRSDLDAARSELAKLRGGIPAKPVGCEPEAEALAKYPY